MTPDGGHDTTDFVDSLARGAKAQRDPRFYCGIGWGADMNGFAPQGGPREGGNR